MRYVQNVRAHPAYDWKQPINFYGRVLDESNAPVANAHAHFEWNDISERGTCPPVYAQRQQRPLLPYRSARETGCT